MSTARFGVYVSALTPFAYRAFRAKRIVSVLVLRGKQLANVHVAQVYPDRAVDQPVNHRVRLDAAAEPPVPFGGRALRAEDRGMRHVPPLYRLEQEADRDVVDVLGQPFVYDQQLVAGVLLQDLRVRPLRGGQLVSLHQQVGQPDVARAAPHVAGTLGYAAGQVALARAGAFLDDDVAGPRHELAGPRLADEHAVHAAALVYHLAHVGVWEAQAGATDQPPHAARALLLVGVVHHHAHALLEQHRHARPVRVLQVERVHHLAHRHLAQLAPGLFVNHRHAPNPCSSPRHARAPWARRRRPAPASARSRARIGSGSSCFCQG